MFGVVRRFWGATVSIETEVTSKGILIIKLHGRMQLTDLQGMEAKFRKLVSGKKAVIVDLSGLEVLFSMGLRALIMSAQILEARGGRLVLMAPTADVLAVLKASGTSKLVPICRNQEEAEAMVAISSVP